jgi:hypothetical protein
MGRLRFALAALVALLTLLSLSAPAQAHGRTRGGVYLHFGVPWGWWWPRYYYYPPPVYYYDYPAPGYPPLAVDRRTPPTYVERDDLEESAPAESASTEQPTIWWYWCPSSRQYYPYVKQCPGGFHRVPSQPTTR